MGVAIKMALADPAGAGRLARPVSVRAINLTCCGLAGAAAAGPVGPAETVGSSGADGPGNAAELLGNSTNSGFAPRIVAKLTTFVSINAAILQAGTIVTMSLLPGIQVPGPLRRDGGDTLLSAGIGRATTRVLNRMAAARWPARAVLGVFLGGKA